MNFKLFAANCIFALFFVNIASASEIEGRRDVRRVSALEARLNGFNASENHAVTASENAMVFDTSVPPLSELEKEGKDSYYLLRNILENAGTGVGDYKQHVEIHVAGGSEKGYLKKSCTEFETLITILNMMKQKGLGDGDFEKDLSDHLLMHNLKLIVSITQVKQTSHFLVEAKKLTKVPVYLLPENQKAHDLSTVKIVVGILIAIAVLAVVAYAYISYNADSEDSDEL